MRFGRRREATQPSVGHPVLGFWRWWNDGGHLAVTEAVTTGEYGRLPETIGRLVADIHPDLEWELGRGREAQHALIVSSGGVAQLRPLAERWLRAAPPTTTTWEFHAARQPDPGVLTAKLQLDGYDLALSEAQVGTTVDEDADVVHVTVWHPGFPALDEANRAQVTFLLLDWLLGEDDVERWIGSVESATVRPENATPASSLTATVAELAARRTEPFWVLMEGSTPTGARRIATARRPLRWIDQPLLDQHNEIRLTYTDAGSDGLPSSEALEHLRALEDDLTRLLGTRAELLAHETGEGARLLHVYSDSEDQNVTALISDWARRSAATASHRHDPAWRELAAFR